MSLITRRCKQTLVRWQKVGVDKFGQPRFANPVQVACRWVDTIEEFIGADGDKRLSTAVIYPISALAVGDMVRLGLITDLVNTSDPLLNTRTYIVRQQHANPNFNNNEIAYTVYV